MSKQDMSIVDHLEELRWRILKSLGSIETADTGKQIINKNSNKAFFVNKFI